MWNALFTACKVGDVDGLHRLLYLQGESEETAEEGNKSDAKNPLVFLNKPIDSSGFTLLHVASAAAQKRVVKLLLDAGADPASRYKKKTVATAKVSLSLLIFENIPLQRQQRADAIYRST